MSKYISVDDEQLEEVKAWLEFAAAAKDYEDDKLNKQIKRLEREIAYRKAVDEGIKREKAELEAQGITPPTWMQDDEAFKKEMDEAIAYMVKQYQNLFDDGTIEATVKSVAASKLIYSDHPIRNSMEGCPNLVGTKEENILTLIRMLTDLITEKYNFVYDVSCFYNDYIDEWYFSGQKIEDLNRPYHTSVHHLFKFDGYLIHYYDVRHGGVECMVEAFVLEDEETEKFMESFGKKFGFTLDEIKSKIIDIRDTYKKGEDNGSSGE